MTYNKCGKPRFGPWDGEIEDVFLALRNDIDDAIPEQVVGCLGPQSVIIQQLGVFLDEWTRRGKGEVRRSPVRDTAHGGHGSMRDPARNHGFLDLDEDVPGKR